MLEHRSAWLVVNTRKDVFQSLNRASKIYGHKAFQITHLHATVINRDESIWGNSHGSHGNPMGLGTTKLILWEWERELEWLDGNGRE